ncbi:hypothetical protein [Nonomuraea candida]|nr:hypothetical protein [Nonomuraea candida]
MIHEIRYGEPPSATRGSLSWSANSACASDVPLAAALDGRPPALDYEGA